MGGAVELAAGGGGSSSSSGGFLRGFSDGWKVAAPAVPRLANVWDAVLTVTSQPGSEEAQREAALWCGRATMMATAVLALNADVQFGILHEFLEPQVH